MEDMEQAWNPSGGSFDNFSFDDDYFDTFFDATGQESAESQPIPTLDGFDFGLHNNNQGRKVEKRLGSSYYSSPVDHSSQLQNQLPKMQNGVDQANSISASTMLLSADPQLVFASQPSSTSISGTFTGSNQSNPQDFSGNYSIITSSAAVAPGQLSYNKSQPEEVQPATAPAPKVRKTRKRKPVSAEEKERKKTAFLARNREAAKKCRAKRKVQQENIHEKSQRLSRYNLQCKAELMELQAMKTELKLELAQLQGIPGVLDEIKSIEVGQPQRPPMFFFHDSLVLLPISEMPSGHSLQSMSRRDSNASYSGHQSGNMSPGGSERSRSNSISSGFLQQQEQPIYVLQQDMRSARQPQPLDTTVGDQKSNHSTPSIARSISQNSGRDSGVENVSPATPKAKSSSVSDEGVIVEAPTPTKRIDPALFSESMDYFSKQHSPQQAFRSLAELTGRASTISGFV